MTGGPINLFLFDIDKNINVSVKNLYLCRTMKNVPTIYLLFMQLHWGLDENT